MSPKNVRDGTAYLCASCLRLVQESDSTCPYCGSVLVDPDAPLLTFSYEPGDFTVSTPELLPDRPVLSQDLRGPAPWSACRNVSEGGLECRLPTGHTGAHRCLAGVGWTDGYDAPTPDEAALRGCSTCRQRTSAAVSNPCWRLCGHSEDGTVRSLADQVRTWRAVNGMAPNHTAPVPGTARDCPGYEFHPRGSGVDQAFPAGPLTIASRGPGVLTDLQTGEEVVVEPELDLEVVLTIEEDRATKALRRAAEVCEAVANGAISADEEEAARRCAVLILGLVETYGGER